ncbi:Transcription factor TGA7 [Ananas comosus]|nr:Transcription factor TGA7 [Ananas comosus]
MEMETFYEGWVAEQERILELLVAAPRDRPDLHVPLVARALAHYDGYRLRRSRVADRDVLRAFDPRWLTPLERSFIWIAGWKPALAFRFVPRDGGVDDEAGGRAAVEELRREVAEEERALAAAMARVQEGLAAPAVVEAVRRPGRNGEERANAAAAVEDSLRRLLDAADALRARTVRTIVDVLQPWEAVRFLAAAAQFHLGLRRAGLQQRYNETRRAAVG